MPIFVVCALSSGNVLLDRQWVSYLFRFCCFILCMHFVRRKSFFISTFLFNFSLDTGCQHTLTGHLMYQISSVVDFLLKCQPYLSQHFATITMQLQCLDRLQLSWMTTFKICLFLFTKILHLPKSFIALFYYICRYEGTLMSSPVSNQSVSSVVK